MGNQCDSRPRPSLSQFWESMTSMQSNLDSLPFHIPHIMSAEKVICLTNDGATVELSRQVRGPRDSVET